MFARKYAVFLWVWAKQKIRSPYTNISPIITRNWPKKWITKPNWILQLNLTQSQLLLNIMTSPYSWMSKLPLLNQKLDFLTNWTPATAKPDANTLNSVSLILFFSTGGGEYVFLYTLFLVVEFLLLWVLWCFLKKKNGFPIQVVWLILFYLWIIIFFFVLVLYGIEDNDEFEKSLYPEYICVLNIED